MGQMFANICPLLMSRPPHLSVFLALLTVSGFGQTSKQAPSSDPSAGANRAIKLAQTGHCEEAVPALKRTSQRLTDKALRKTAASAGVRCAMLLNQTDAAVSFLQMLNQDFPADPEVLYLSVHTYSDLSTRAAQRLAMTAPYRRVLEQDPHQSGVHFLLGRLLLSKPDPDSTAGEEAKKEFQEELKIDPSNAGAEYVLGEMARQASQWPDAIQHFTRATELDAGFGDAFLGLGTSLLSAKRFPEAIPPLEAAVKLEPRNPAAHYNLATAFTRTGRRQDADREFAIHRQMTQKDDAGQGQPPAQPPNPN